MITANIQNLQGDSFPNAIIVISDADFGLNVNKNHNTQAGVVTENNSSTNTLKYRVCYWKDQAAFDAGKSPYVLNSKFIVDLNSPNPDQTIDYRSLEDKLWHIATNVDDTYLLLTAEKMAEKHLQEVVLV